MGKWPVGAIKGVSILNIGLVLFVVHDAVSKVLLTRYPLFEVIFIRSLIALPLVLLIARWEQGSLRLRSHRVGALLLRGLLSVAAFAFFLVGLSLMPLGETFALFSSAPLIVAALAGPLLREPATRRQWVAVLIGFAAVLFMVRPGGNIPLLGGLAMLASVGCFSLGIILTRSLGRTESTSLITVYVIGSFVAVGAIASPFGWTPPTTEDFALMTLIGLLVAVAMFCTINAYKNVAPALAAPFQYTQLVWAMILGYLVWGDVPDATVIVAAVVVVLSGIYVLHSEGRG